MGGREGGEGWRTPQRTGGQTRSRRVSGAGSVRCGRRGCAAAEVLCCSTVPDRARTSPRSPARAPRVVSTAVRGPVASARLSRVRFALNSLKSPQPWFLLRPVSICQLWGYLRNFGPRRRAAGRAGLAECGARAPPTSAGSRSAADALRGPGDGRLLGPPARSRRPPPHKVRDVRPPWV